MGLIGADHSAAHRSPAWEKWWFLAIVAACMTVGCEQPIAAVRTYKPARANGLAAAENQSILVKAINGRLGAVGRARPLNDGNIAVDVYGPLKPADLEIIKRLVGTQGELEFRIMAAPQAAAHQAIIELAERLPADRNLVRPDDRPVARWVEIDEREFGDVDQARSRGLVVRMAGQTPQALAMVDDGLDVTGQYLRSATADIDETGRPQISFTFNSQGAFKFGQLTGNHVPTPAGDRFMLGILLDHRLLTAPTIESKITDRGRISGGAMDDAEVELFLTILNEGILPCRIRLVEEQLAPTSPQ